MNLFRTQLLPTDVRCTEKQAAHTMLESMIAITLTAVGSASALQESWAMKRMEKEFPHGAPQPLSPDLKPAMSYAINMEAENIRFLLYPFPEVRLR